MGKFSLEFGRKGPEGLKAEHDEGIRGAYSKSEEPKTAEYERAIKELTQIADKKVVSKKEKKKESLIPELEEAIKTEEEVLETDLIEMSAEEFEEFSRKLDELLPG